MYMGVCQYLVVGVVLNFYELVGEIRAVMSMDLQKATELLNGEIGYRFSEKWSISARNVESTEPQRPRYRLRVRVPNHANRRAGIHRRFPCRRTLSGAIRTTKKFLTIPQVSEILRNRAPDFVLADSCKFVLQQ
jgi:hypothetical protein